MGPIRGSGAATITDDGAKIAAVETMAAGTPPSR
jgi:hypothetical protein